MCNTDDVQDEQHVRFYCANPHMISFRRKYASVSPTIDPPSSDTMLALVAEQIGKLNGRASPGFDCLAASFIKNAVVVRPKPDGRGSERVNVLAPYIVGMLESLTC